MLDGRFVLSLGRKNKIQNGQKYRYHVEIFFLMTIYNWKPLMKRFEDEKKKA